MYTPLHPFPDISLVDVMRVYTIILTSFILLFSISCAPTVLLTTDNIQQERIQENTIYRIVKEVDLQGRTITLPQNCTLCFSKNGSLKNGTIIGQNTRIRYSKPFIGESLTILGCRIVNKKLIKDTDVFLSVNHIQSEIQTLFDLSGGIKVSLSQGTYENVERIEINNNVDADFNNSIIRLAFDKYHVGECFYMEPWVDKNLDYVKIKDLSIVGKLHGVSSPKHRSCIQLFYVSEVVLDGVSIDQFYGGPNEYKSDGSDLEDKTRLGTNIINIINYDKCFITNCSTNDLNKEIFWCVPNTNPKNITYFTNNKSTSSSVTGSASFFTLLDGRCVVKNNEVYNYNGSAFNLFCYDSEICDNRFYYGKRSIAIDLSEGILYRSKNVYVHDNECIDTKGLIQAYGENLRIENNRWNNSLSQEGERFYIITISTRDERLTNRNYLGCDNNPDQDRASIGVYIKNNYLIDNGSNSKCEVRCAIVWGSDISFSNNTFGGSSLPVVQFVSGRNFSYSMNKIVSSKEGNYAELLVNNCDNITVTNNTFSRNYTDKDQESTIHIIKALGFLSYKANTTTTDINSQNGKPYIPCYISDYTCLENAEIFVDKERDCNRIETGIDDTLVVLKTNF